MHISVFQYKRSKSFYQIIESSSVSAEVFDD